MGLVLNNQQTNDAKILYLTDASTWGSDGLPAYTSITAAELEIYYKDPDYPDGTAVQTIDVTDIFTGASTAADLIFPVIINSGNIGVADSGVDQLPDGIWVIEYNVTWSGGNDSFDSPLELLLDGVLKADIYSKLATVNYQYLCSNNYYTKPIDDVLLLYCLRQGVLANAYVAQQSNIVDTIETIQLLLE